jgi:hypothetical protein
MDRLWLIDDDPAPKTIILISRVLIETDISMAMRFDHLCDDGAPFTRAIGAASVVRLADLEILDDLDPAWRETWATGTTVRRQYARAAKACDHAGPVRDILVKYCPEHRMFDYQLIENGRVRPSPLQRAMIRRDVADPLQARHAAELTVTNLAEQT